MRRVGCKSPSFPATPAELSRTKLLHVSPGLCSCLPLRPALFPSLALCFPLDTSTNQPLITQDPAPRGSILPPDQVEILFSAPRTHSAHGDQEPWHPWLPCLTALLSAPLDGELLGGRLSLLRLYSPGTEPGSAQEL